MSKQSANLFQQVGFGIYNLELLAQSQTVVLSDKIFLQIWQHLSRFVLAEQLDILFA